ncbi:MAG: SGNH/GDSL hydrolase family protein [Lentisphaerae bacterium]|jgi:lysophospholipase L1-like esterase|nr:SGNH/GDSL hydrolase family protein [Lentisphaerota bacterium]MBT4818647.1 SGNH/GDSL hydrolase family protein [Lentisphaerota bacterium]MBT5611356.1 SGNH/GDSL hydrolase family protein [Lentisphaerota bacterium]MBT7060340.1 SGNH/GDSL hydrolase family protein [Lentisphaerota bacterium]MBT7842261.1 SGNH/GDSL hydrolase family protein [Lentisphaerota bacterium]
MKRLVFFALTMVCLLGASPRAEVFKDGDRVCFLGDSITHTGAYHGMIYDYYLTRFPERTIRFINAGVAGDSAGGAMGRLQEDVFSKTPTTVVVMLGMNDVGRGNYVAEPTEGQLKAQAASLKWHQANMDKLLGRIRSEIPVRFVLMTPSPFDQTCVNDRDNNRPGCNDALATCGKMARELAPKYQAEVIDLHGPMTALNREQQKADPRYTLIGPDRIHPRTPGNLAMAYFFLKGQGVPSLVSTVGFDARSGKVKQVENADVSGIRRAADGWTFTVTAKALPFPVPKGARGMLELVPLEQDLNQEFLRVEGLAGGTHVLSIDGTAVATHTAAEWAAGINLASNQATPQVKQAEKVAKINETRRRTEGRLRGYASVRWFLRHRRIDPDDLAAVKEFAETKMNKNGWYERQVPTYLAEWPKRDEVVARVVDLEEEAFAARIPVPHVYEILAGR